jgi:hypothetical protein
MTKATTLEVPRHLNVMRELKVGDARLRGAVGPTDFPERVRVQLDDQVIRITFFYVDAVEEPVTTYEWGDAKVVTYGADSGRVFSISAPARSGARAGLSDVTVPATNALREMRRKAGSLKPSKLPARRAFHYELLRDIIPWAARSAAAALL